MSTYKINEPIGGRKKIFTEKEKRKLRPVAETLAMLDGNAFFTMDIGDGKEFYEHYLSEAHALYEDNGGDNGWAGEASFVHSRENIIEEVGAYLDSIHHNSTAELVRKLKEK